jgi:uncharacterized membrane protein
MRPAVLIGVLLIFLGVVSLAYQGFTYTKREKVIDLGPIQATTETKKTVPLPPIVGIAALGLGAVLVLVGNKK